MNDYIDITGCDLIALVKKAYELSVPQGMGFLHARPGGLTDEEAKSLIREGDCFPVNLDYVAGRAVKLTVHSRAGKLEIHSRWYDHSDAQLAELLDAIGIKRPASLAA